MRVAGVDVGSLTAKAVILDGDHILASTVMPVENTTEIEADRVLDITLKKVGLTRDCLSFVVSTAAVPDTWVGSKFYLSEVSCAANGALYYYPLARTIIDMGAENCFCTKCDGDGIVLDYVANQKCASGTGLFLDLISGVLEVRTEDIGKLSLDSKKDLKMNLTCAVFAESEVVSLIHQGEKREDIINSLHRSIASRVGAMLKAIKFKEEVILIGGVAKNIGMAKTLSSEIGVQVRVPANPETVVALGAALEAKALA